MKQMTLLETPKDVKHYCQTQNLLNNEKLEISELTGGVSNRTFLIDRRPAQSWVLKQAREKLKVEADWFCDPKRIHREALGMKYLKELAPAGSIVALIHEDEHNHVIIMEAVADPNVNWKTLLMRGDINFSHIQQFAQILASIHSRSIEHQDELMPLFNDNRYFELLRLEPYYGNTASRIDEAQSFLQILIEQTRQIKICITHGDYSPKNVLVHDDRMILLDHEVIHWGDPAFDIGFSMTHLLSKSLHLKTYRNEFLLAAHAYWKFYQLNVSDLINNNNFEKRCIQHTMACMLARVAGRSPLEYLSLEDKTKQQNIIIELMKCLSESLPDLINDFADRIN